MGACRAGRSVSPPGTSRRSGRRRAGSRLTTARPRARLHRSAEADVPHEHHRALQFQPDRCCIMTVSKHCKQNFQATGPPMPAARLSAPTARGVMRPNCSS